MISAEHDKQIDTENWNEDGVMFIYETPTFLGGQKNEVDEYKSHFQKIMYKDVTKFPTYKWYFVWLCEKERMKDIPNEFEYFGKRREYDRLIINIILIFELKNAYVTDFVKCGYSAGGKHKKEIITTCYNTFLQREIKILSPKIIFTFGDKAYNYLNKYADNLIQDIKIVKLLHPAQQTKTNIEMKENHLGKIARTLYDNRIIENSLLNTIKKELKNIV